MNWWRDSSPESKKFLREVLRKPNWQWRNAAELLNEIRVWSSAAEPWRRSFASLPLVVQSLRAVPCPVAHKWIQTRPKWTTWSWVEIHSKLSRAPWVCFVGTDCYRMFRKEWQKKRDRRGSKKAGFCQAWRCSLQSQVASPSNTESEGICST